MRNHRPYLELDDDPVFKRAIGQALGIIQHCLVGAYVNQQWREFG